MFRSFSMLVIGHLILGIITLTPGIAFSGWLSGYSYRKQFTINGSTAGALTNYQMELFVNKVGDSDSGNNVYLNYHCQDDFDDIRFTKSNGTTELDHWRETYIPSESAIFWVAFDSIPASPDSANFYIYYGNPTDSSASNISIWPEVKIKVETSLANLYICGEIANQDTWVSCRLYHGVSDTTYTEYLNNCPGWYPNGYTVPCHKFQVYRNCTNISDCSFHSMGTEYGIPWGKTWFDVAPLNSSDFDYTCDGSCQWQSSTILYGYQSTSNCACCDCRICAITKLTLKRADPEPTWGTWEPVGIVSGKVLPKTLGLTITPTVSDRGFRIQYDIPKMGDVSLKVYDKSGRLVKMLFDGELSAGSYSISWDGKDASSRAVKSGTYFCKLKVDGVETKKMVVIK